MKERNDLIDRVQYWGLRVVDMALHWFPVETNLKTARLLGSLIYHLWPKAKDRVQGNLRRSFPELSETQRRALGEQSLQHLIMLFVEILFTTRLVRVDTWRRYFELRDFE